MASIILGGIGLFLVLLGLIPFCGFFNWIALPLLIVGIALGINCILKDKKRILNIIGAGICAVFMIIGIVRIATGLHRTKKVLKAANETAEAVVDSKDELSALVDDLNSTLSEVAEESANSDYTLSDLTNDLESISEAYDELKAIGDVLGGSKKEKASKSKGTKTLNGASYESIDAKTLAFNIDKENVKVGDRYYLEDKVFGVTGASLSITSLLMKVNFNLPEPADYSMGDKVKIYFEITEVYPTVKMVDADVIAIK